MNNDLMKVVIETLLQERKFINSINTLTGRMIRPFVLVAINYFTRRLLVNIMNAGYATKEEIKETEKFLDT